MKLSKKYIFGISLLFLFLKLPIVLSLGVSPGFIDLGTLEKGSTKIVKFYVITTTGEKYLVKLEASEVNLDFFKRDKYRDLIYEYSEQPVRSWIDFINNPVELKSIEGKRGQAEVNLVLKIPENAEPGYHAVTIDPTPVVPEKTSPMGVGVVGVVGLNILFRVSGDVLRTGRILDITSGGIKGNRLELNVFFQNEGTVTMSSRADSIKIYDDSGKVITSVPSNIDHLKPGEIKVLKAYVYDKLEPGIYNVSANVNYITGSVSKNSTIVYELIPTGEIVSPAEEYKFPFWLLIIPIIIILAYLVHKWWD